MIGSVNSHQL